jgi:hypothetical protein
MTGKIRWAAAALAAVLLVGLTLSLPPLPAPPAHATAVTGESTRSDDWVTTNTAISGIDYEQGYSRKRPVYFNDGNRPDCALATGRSPTGSGASNLPVGVRVRENSAEYRTPAQHYVEGKTTGGAGISGQFTYWVHAQQDNTGDNTNLCQHTTVTTTDQWGYFNVTFPRTLAATPAAVNWSYSEPAGTCGSSALCWASNNMVTSKSSTGFTGRAASGNGTWLDTRTIEIDYWAVTSSSVDTTDEQGQPFFFVAGEMSVTTDANGNATIDHANLPAAPSAGQVTGVAPNGVNTTWLPGGVILDSIGQNSSTIHVRNLAGSVMASRTFSVDYVIVGNQGGSAHPWGDYGWRMFGFAGAPEPNTDVCDGDTTVCSKLPDEETAAGVGFHSYEYAIEQSVIDEGSLEGATYWSMAVGGVNSWDAADLDIPGYSRDTTPDGNEQLVFEAESVPAPDCAVTDNYYSAYEEDGVNLISHTNIIQDSDDSELWGRVGGDYEECPAEHIYLHEFGHGLGFAHTEGVDSGDSVMHAGPVEDLTTLHTTLANADRDHARAVYGYSGSFSAARRYSDYVHPGEGFSTGLVTVVGHGPAYGGRLNLPRTPLHVGSRESWNGSLPAVIWQKAGVYNGLDGGPTLQPGRYVVVVRNSDGRLFRALPVNGNTVQVPEDWYHITDDVDGGSKATVALDRLHAKAA